MKQKGTLGKYILQKRKEAGPSQRELAHRLFVSESVVSKWERGLSSPDITLISSLSSVLNISDHELMTACDDQHQRGIEEQAHSYLRFVKTYSWLTWLGYAALPSALALESDYRERTVLILDHSGRPDDGLS